MSLEFKYWKWIFLIISILTFNIVALKTRKQLPNTVIYSTTFFALCIQQYFDSYAAFFFKAWGFFSVDTADFPSLLVKWGIYPAAIVMIINWYPYKSSMTKRFCYIMGWSVFSTAFEWVTMKLGILWHIHWNLLYSFIIYPIIFYLFLILHVKFYQWLIRKESS